eukprot:m51a1_g3353 hypothetical protein (79) ;mRNA; r:415094-415423
MATIDVHQPPEDNPEVSPVQRVPESPDGPHPTSNMAHLLIRRSSPKSRKFFDSGDWVMSGKKETGIPATPKDVHNAHK